MENRNVTEHLRKAEAAMGRAEKAVAKAHEELYYVRIALVYAEARLVKVSQSGNHAAETEALEAYNAALDAEAIAENRFYTRRTEADETLYKVLALHKVLALQETVDSLIEEIA